MKANNQPFFSVSLPTLMVLAGVFLMVSCNKNPVNTQGGDEEERILFLRGGKGISEICSMKPDGSDVIVINRHNSSDDAYYPEGYMFARWSPDKSKIVVQGGPGNTLDYWPLWLMDMEGNLMYRLTWNGWNPLWKNDTEIIFRRVFTSWDIYSIDVNTQEEQLIYLQNDTLAIGLTDISRDGKFTLGLFNSAILDSSDNLVWPPPSIAKFEIGSWENYNILVPNDSKVSLNVIPKWSPDETLISYSLMDDSYTRNLYLMTAEGDSLYRLTDETNTNPYAFTSYEWSPDGQYLAYSKPNQGEEWNSYVDIFIIDIQSGDIQRLTDTAKDSISNIVMDWK